MISYVLNRVLNFRSHDDVGRQFPVYVAVSASNYLIFVLGLTDLLSAVGVYYELSRVIAACCEAVYLYTMLRFVVFRGSPGAQGAQEQAPRLRGRRRSRSARGTTAHGDAPATTPAERHVVSRRTRLWGWAGLVQVPVHHLARRPGSC